MNNAQIHPKPQEGKAVTIKKTFSRETMVSLTILADPAIVWNLLTHASDYPRWNSTVTSLKGEIKEGGTIELKSTLEDEKRTFKLKVKEFAPEKRLVWGDSQGSRVYTLTKGANNVLFTMSEKIGGPLFPLFAGYIPPFDESFERFAADLKKEAETIQKSER